MPTIEVGFMTVSLDNIISLCTASEPLRTAVVHPVNSRTLTAVRQAFQAGLIDPILIGPGDRIDQAAAECGVDLSRWQIRPTEHSHEAAEVAAELASGQQVGAILKGALHTDELLGAIISSGSGLRTERRISHAYLMTIGSYPRPFIISDAAVNITPDLSAKADIVQNAVDLWHVLYPGPDALPKVAILAAVETVNPQMTATLDAAALCKMADRGQITDCVIDGPLAFDNAVSAEAAAEKGIVSDVAGAADILIVPDIEAGNMLAKQLTFLGGAEAAGIVLGARVPVILTSRADSERSRLVSCAIAVLLAEARAAGRIK